LAGIKQPPPKLLYPNTAKPTIDAFAKSRKTATEKVAIETTVNWINNTVLKNIRKWDAPDLNPTIK
jgi:hypothetical protein